jgi:hypothetical protein
MLGAVLRVEMSWRLGRGKVVWFDEDMVVVWYGWDEAVGRLFGGWKDEEGLLKRLEARAGVL